MPGIFTSPRPLQSATTEESFPVIQKLMKNSCSGGVSNGNMRKCCPSTMRSGSGGIKGVTMFLLASYLLIFTVVTSFVTSQPVTNLPTTRNKLITTTAATQSTSRSPPSSSPSPARNDNTPTTTSSSSSVSTDVVGIVPSAPEKEIQTAGLPPLFPTVLMEMAKPKKELNLFIPNELGTKLEKKPPPMLHMHNTNHNDNDDVSFLLVTGKNTNTWSIITATAADATTPGTSEERSGSTEGKMMARIKFHERDVGNKEVARDKDKVMVTDDVKGSSSSQIVNPSHLSSSSLSSQNDNSRENNSASPSFAGSFQNNSSILATKMMTLVEDGNDGEESKVNSGTGTSKMNLNESLKIMSTSKQDLTFSHSLDGNANNVIVNNHANFIQIQQTHQQEEQHTSPGRGDHPDTTDDDDDGDNKSYHKVTLSDKLEQEASHSDSPTPKGNRHFKSSRVTMLARPATEKNSSDKSTTSPFTSSPPLSSASLLEGGGNKDEDEDERRVNEISKEDQQQQLPSHHPRRDEYLNDSPALSLNGNPPPISPPPLLMNKWIKTLVKLSQCWATCLDQAEALVHHRMDPIQATALLVDFVGEEEADSDTRWRNHHFQEGTGGGGALSAPQHVPSSAPNWSDSLNDKEEKTMMPVVYPEQTKNKETITSGNPLVRLLPSSSSGAPSRTIKVTPSKSMKYYELSSCQESCRRRFPVPESSNFAGDDDDPDVSMNSQAENENGETSPAKAASPPTSGNTERLRSNNSDRHNGGNNNNNENIETKQTPNRTSNNYHQQQHYLVSRREKEEPQQQQQQLVDERNQLPRKVEREVEPKHDIVEVPVGQPAEVEANRNENIISQSGNRRAEPLTQLFAIEPGAERDWKYSTVADSLNKLKTFPTEPRLKVIQLSLKNGESEEHEKKDGRSTTTFPSSSFLLRLTWPKPSSSDRVVGSGNNNNRPEGPAPAQVKDKKGIDHRDDNDDDKVEKERNKERYEHESQGPEDISSEPITVYSIILEESWEQVRSDGTKDRNARQWKLIDQTVARTTAQISLPAIVPLATEHKKRNNHGKERAQPSEEQVTVSAFTQKKNKENAKMGEQIKEKRVEKYSPRIMRAPPPPPPPLLLADDLPSKVTLFVLVVTGKRGLVQVYSAELNNSYYHMNEHDHQQDKTNGAGDKERHPKPPEHLYQTSLEDPNQLPIHVADRDNLTSTKFPNEKAGNQVGVVLNRKIGGEEKEVKFEKKVEVSRKERISSEASSESRGSSNENSNHILAFPSIESLSQTMRKGLSGEMKVKNLMSRLRQKNINFKRKTHLVTNFIDSPADKGGSAGNANETNRTNANNLLEGRNKVDPLAAPFEDAEETQNWGLHTVSMVYQKFLVVTQITWDYPGNVDEDEEEDKNFMFFSHESSSSNKGNDEISPNNKNDTGDTVAFKLSLGNKRGDAEDTKKMARRSSPPAKKWRGCGGGDHRRDTAKGGKHQNEKSGVDSGKLNFLLSWEIFGGGLRGNLVTDTCSASISLWPDTVYIIQVGLITPGNSSNSSETTLPATSYSTTFKYEVTESSADNGQSSHDNGESFRHNADPETLVADMDDDVDEISTWKWKTDKTNNLRISVKNSPLTPETLQRSNPLFSYTHAALNVRHGAGVVERSPPLVAPSSSATPSSDPLILPESITFPFDGEPKVTIKSERILVNTTRASASSDDDGISSLGTASHNQDKVTQGTSQSNNNFPRKNKTGTKGYSYWKSTSGKEMVKNFDGDENDGTSSNAGSDSSVSSMSGGISDKVYVSPITITRNDDGSQNGPVFPVNDQPATAADLNENIATADVSATWEEDDDMDADETSDQDESLFARSLAHQHHHQQQHRRPPPPQAHTQSNVDDDSLNSKPKSLLQYASESPNNGRRLHNFLTVNSFYQSLYALSQNALDLSNRYPNVITISNGGAAIPAGGGPSSNAREAGSLVLGEFTQTNKTGGDFLYRGSNGDGDDQSTFKGKLYTLFVILVISFVVFLFIVAIVGFCVLTSSIKENYKYFVPKKVRVWTTVGQLFKGPSASTSGADDSSGGAFKDSAEGSFYPRRLQEEPDYEFEENDDFDPDEEEEEVTSVADTDEEEEEESECCECHCIIENDSNSFSLNERTSSCYSSSDTATLIRVGEESSVELMVAPSSSTENLSSRIRNSETCVGGGEHCCCVSSSGSNGNCDNSNPCYQSLPGGKTCLSPKTTTNNTKTSTVAAAISSLKRNFHLSQQHNHQHHHHHHHKRKQDVRIDVTSRSSRTRGQTNQRQQGYY